MGMQVNGKLSANHIMQQFLCELAIVAILAHEIKLEIVFTKYAFIG